MDKESFLDSLSDKQRNYVQFLIDASYAEGYSRGKLEYSINAN